MSDLVLVILIALAFASVVTVQIAILAGLLRRRQPWRALSGLLMPPLSVYWAYVGGMRLRAVIWLVSASLYLSTIALALLRG